MPFNEYTPAENAAYWNTECQNMNLFDRMNEPMCNSFNIGFGTPGITGPVATSAPTLPSAPVEPEAPTKKGAIETLLKYGIGLATGPVGLATVAADDVSEFAGETGQAVSVIMQNAFVVFLGLVIVLGAFIVWSSGARQGIVEGVKETIGS